MLEQIKIQFEAMKQCYKLAVFGVMLALLTGCVKIETTSVIDEMGNVKLTSDQDFTTLNEMRGEDAPDDPCEDSLFGEDWESRECVASVDGNHVTMTGSRTLDKIEEWEEENGYFRLSVFPSGIDFDEEELEEGIAAQVEYTENIQFPGEILWASNGEIEGNILRINIFNESNKYFFDKNGILNFEVVVRGDAATGDVPWEQVEIPAEDPAHENDCGENLDCFIVAAERCQPAYVKYYTGYEIKGVRDGKCVLYRHFMEDECLFDTGDLAAVFERFKNGEYEDSDWETCEFAHGKIITENENGGDLVEAMDVPVIAAEPRDSRKNATGVLSVNEGGEVVEGVIDIPSSMTSEDLAVSLLGEEGIIEPDGKFKIYMDYLPPDFSTMTVTRKDTGGIVYLAYYRRERAEGGEESPTARTAPTEKKSALLRPSAPAESAQKKSALLLPSTGLESPFLKLWDFLTGVFR